LFSAIPGEFMLDLFNRFVSSEGRISRRTYVMVFVAPFAALLAFTWLVMFVAPPITDALPVAAFNLPWIVFLATADAQNMKRYHDLGVSGALYKAFRPLVVVLPVLALVVQFILPSFMAMSGDMDALFFLIRQDLGGFSFGPLPLALFGITLAGVVLNIGYLSAMPGQSGPNMYGPDPSSNTQIPGMATAQAGEDDDPVKRALARYQAQQSRPAMVTPVRPGPAGAGFGRKRR
jgi:uncharacterized membrane protein YhaH (DUF805 family)